MNIGVIDALIRLRDEFSPKLKQLGENLDKTGRELSKISAVIVGVGIVTGKLASDFEESFAGVRKTIDATEGEFAELEKSLRSLNTTAGKPFDINVINKVAESAGQLGIAKEDIVDFTSSMLDLEVSTDLTADAAASNIAKFQNIFGSVGKDVDRFGSTLVALGNVGASTESQILSMGLRIAGAGNQIGISQGQVLAIANALSSMGIEAEAGGSAVSKLLSDMALAVAKGGKELRQFAEVSGKTSEEFQKAFRDDAAAAFTDFIEGIGSVDGEQAVKILDAMGISEVRMTDAIKRAAGAGDLLRDSLDLQARAWAENNALVNEASKRYETARSKLIVVVNKLKDAGITIGQALLPTFTDLLAKLDPLITKVASLAESFANLPEPVRLTIITISGVVAAAGPLLIVFGQIASSVSTLLVYLPGLATTFTSLATGPVGIVVAIGAIIFSVDELKEAFGSSLQSVVDTAKDIFQDIQEQFSDLSPKVQELGGKILDLASQMGERLVDALRIVIDLTGRHLELVIESVGEVARLAVEFANWAASIPGVVTGLSTLFDWLLKLNEAIVPLGLLIKTFDTLAKKQKEVLAPAANPWDMSDWAFDLDSPLADLVALSAGYKNLAGETGKANKATGDINFTFDKEKDKLGLLRAELLRNLDTNKLLIKAYGDVETEVLSATEKEVQAIERKSELLEQYHQDIEQFGIKGANSLKSIREALYDSAKAADVAKVGWVNAAEKAKESWAKFDALIEKNNDILIAAVEEDLKKFAEFNQSMALFVSKLEQERIQGLAEGRQLIFDIEVQIAGPYHAALLQAGAWFGDMVAQIERAMVEGKINPEEAEAARTLLVEDYAKQRYEIEKKNLDDTLGYATQALGFLSDKFGGFFGYLFDLANGLQQAFAFGDAVKGFATGLQNIGSSAANASGAINGVGTAATTGGVAATSSGAMAAVAGVATVVAVFAVVYDFVDKMIKAKNQLKYGTRADFQLTGGEEGTSYFDEAGQKLIRSIRGLVRDIEDSLRISIIDLEQIGIKVRNDGKRTVVTVGGEMVGVFEDMNEAIMEAFRVALSHGVEGIAGISDLMTEGLEQWTAPDMEEMLRFLSDLREISDMGLSSNAIKAEETLRHLDRLWKAIEQIGKASDATVEGMRNLGMATIRTFQDWSDSITGRQRDPKEQLDLMKQDAVLFNAKKKMQIAEWQLKILDLQQQAMVVRNRANILRASVGVDQVGLEAGSTFLKGKAMMVQTEINVTNAYLEFINAMISQLEIMIAELEKIPDIDPEKLKLPKIRKGGAGRSEKEEVADFIADKKMQLAMAKMGEWKQSMAEINNSYDEMMKKADAKQKKELEALREQEIREARQERKKEVADKFKSFLGLSTEFDAIRESAEDLVKEIQDSPYGDPKKAAMIGAVMADVQRQVTELSQSKAVGLFGSLISELEKLGLKDTELSTARMAMAKLEHAIKVRQFGIELELIRAQGALTDEQMAALDEAYKLFKDASPPTPGDTRDERKETMRARAQERAAEAATTLAEALKKATDLLQKYKDQGLSPYHKALGDLDKDFGSIRKMLGNTPEVANEYRIAMGRLHDQFTKNLQDVYKELVIGDLSSSTTQQQFDFASSEVERLGNLIASTGDLSKQNELADAIRRYAELSKEMFGGATGGTIGGVRSLGFEGIRQDLIDKLGGILGPDFLNTLNGLSGGTNGGQNISGPQWFATGTNNTIQQLKDGSERQIDATRDVATIMEQNARRSDGLLETMIDRMDMLIGAIGMVENAVVGLEDNRTHIG